MKNSPEASRKAKFMHPDEQNARFAARHLPEPIANRYPQPYGLQTSFEKMLRI